jgi:hypothetical protein
MFLAIYAAHFHTYRILLHRHFPVYTLSRPLEKVISHIPSGLFVPHGSHKNHLFPHWLLLSVVQKGAVI